MTININAEFQRILIERFDNPAVDALVLMGSYARGTAHEYSDVDLVRLTNVHGPSRERAFHGLIDGKLVIVNDLGSAAIEDTFTKPDVASSYLMGFRLGRPLVDRDDAFVRVQARANAFTWDAEMQDRANAWASEALADWGEDMRKGLAGLRSDTLGELLNARFASSWGLSRVMQIQRGVLLTSGNDFYDAVTGAVGADSEWVRLRRITFALPNASGETPNIREQVIAGLHLYVETARLLDAVLRDDDKPLIEQSVALIKDRLRDERMA